MAKDSKFIGSLDEWRTIPGDKASEADPSYLPEIKSLLAPLGISPAPKVNVYRWLKHGGKAKLHAAGVKLLPYTQHNAAAMLLASLRVHPKGST